jgi:C-terminal processing protease CtpA/Prc
VQTLFNPFIQKDYYIKLTVARYYSPTGLTLQVHGVSPDIAVPPTLDGKMPLGFREEDLSHHLSAITGKRSNPNQAYVERVKSCVGKSGMARKVHDSDPNPAVKFDYQLMYAADALKCMISNPTRLAKHRVVR